MIKYNAQYNTLSFVLCNPDQHAVTLFAVSHGLGLLFKLPSFTP